MLLGWFLCPKKGSGGHSGTHLCACTYYLAIELGSPLLLLFFPHTTLG